MRLPIRTFVTLTLICTAALLASSQDRVRTFNFTLTEMTYIQGKQVGTDKSGVYTIEVNFYGEGFAKVLVGMKNYKLGEWSGKWTLKKDGPSTTLEIGTTNDRMLICGIGGKQVINIAKGEKITLWGKPQSSKTYNVELIQMLSFLRQNGLVKESSSNSSSSILSSPSTTNKSLKAMPFGALFGSLLGYIPTGSTFTLQTIKNKAKSVYGLTLQNLPDGTVGYRWPNHDGMSFAGCPIESVDVWAKTRNVGNFGVISGSLAIDGQSEEDVKERIRQEFKRNGWTLYASRPDKKSKYLYDLAFYKGRWEATFIFLNANILLFDCRLHNSQEAIQQSISIGKKSAPASY